MNDKYKTYLYILLLVCISLLLRIWGAFDITEYLDDESFHVPSAVSMLESGTPLTSNWTHPPVGALILMASIKIFGNNPVGWRIGGILFGAATVIMMYLVAERLYRDQKVALVAALFLALDPFHIYYSRTTFMEIPVTFFFLVFIYFAMRYHDTDSFYSLSAVGLSLGVTVSTKGYYAASLMMVLLYLIYRKWHSTTDKVLLVLTMLLCLAVIPAAVYLSTYFHFFARGFSLYEFIQMRFDALQVLKNITASVFENQWLLTISQKPWEWFIKPSVHGFSISPGRYYLEMNNFPVRLLSLAALFFLGWYGVKKRNAADSAMPLLFSSVYVLFLVLDRPLLNYSALVVLPFAYLALARVVVLIDSMTAAGYRLKAVISALVVVWSLYLYPLATAKPVSEKLYAPILAIAKMYPL